MTAFDGIVLSGGQARRLGGNKPLQNMGSRSLLAIGIRALLGAAHVVVVGPPTPSEIRLARTPTWVREDPPGGGPVAALAAGLPLTTAEVVVVLAADLPFVTVEVVDRLVDAAPAIAVDADGRDQPLLAAYLAADLLRALPEQTAGTRLRAVVDAQKGLRRLRFTTHPPPWWDCDTPEELEQAREWHDAG